jgi:nucleoid-associated protein EbfC
MNPMDMLKNFKDLQGKMDEMQSRLRETTVLGTAGGDMVRIHLNGQMEVTGVEISEEAVDPSDIPMLQDLVLAAFTDASYKMKEKLKDEFSSMTGGLNLPPGFMGT